MHRTGASAVVVWMALHLCVLLYLLKIVRMQIGSSDVFIEILQKFIKYLNDMTFIGFYFN